jgi:hypothetical protein
LSSKLERIQDNEPSPEDFLTLEVHNGNDTTSKNFKARVVRKLVADKGFLDAQITAAHELSSGNWSIEGTRPIGGTERRRPFGMLVSKEEVQRTISQMQPPGDQPGRII